MNPILKRIVTALTTAAIVVLALLHVPMAFVVPVLILLVGLVHLEFSQMVARKHEIMVWPGVLAGVAYLCSRFYPAFFGGWVGSLPMIMLAGLFLSSLFCRFKSPLVAAGTTMLGFFYIPFMLSSFMMIANVHGVMMFLYVIAIVKFSDMGGFAFGISSKKLMGDNHRMCPTISPNKSWEGMLGSIIASLLMSAAFMPVTHFALPKAMAFGVVAAVVGTLGDLVESRFKRECEVKDSATFMPAGLGGFLDMFDSLVFAPAVLFPFI